MVHHGGAGTTSAGLRAGNPTFICPFFGDQHFWAEMVCRSGAGPPGCPIGQLTVEKLVDAFTFMRRSETVQCAEDLGRKMAAEDGVSNGVASFHQHLPLSNMLCEVSIFDEQNAKLACIYCETCGLKMCSDVDKILHRSGSGRENDHVRLPFKPSRWGVVAPEGLIDGLSQGIGVAAYEMAGGLYDLFASPIEGGLRDGLKGAVAGLASGTVKLFARPMKGGKVLVERVYTGTKGSVTGAAAPVRSALEVEASVTKMALHGSEFSFKALQEKINGSPSGSFKVESLSCARLVPLDNEYLSPEEAKIEKVYIAFYVC